MMYIRYSGEFVAIDGSIIRAEILQEATTAFSVRDLDFPASEPIKIDWSERAKEEPICGSSATLKIISPTDRAFEDLYTEEVGAIRLDVYRDGQIYWSGSLDTEFYEEPYERVDGYEVSLTFSDFGVLERLNYTLDGMQSAQDILEHALSMAKLRYVKIDASMISTDLRIADEVTRLDLSTLEVRSDNFYDEDGEPSSLKKVLEGIFQPLNIRLIQRHGTIFVYDLNGLYESYKASNEERVDWSGSRQSLGVDRVYNNAKITWSTYAQSGNLLPDGCWRDGAKTPNSVIALNDLDGEMVGDDTVFSYRVSYKNGYVDDAGFSLWTSDKGKNASLNIAKFGKFVPIYDGTENEGILLRWTAFNLHMQRTSSGGREEVVTKRRYGATKSDYILPPNLTQDTKPFATFKNAWFPPVSNSGELRIRIKMNALFDVRHNPFEEAEDVTENEKDKYWSDEADKRANRIYQPVRILCRDASTNELFVWDNRDFENPRGKTSTGIDAGGGSWIPYTGSEYGYLCWYDKSDISKSCIGGWRGNRQTIQHYANRRVYAISNAEDGQYIPYPPAGPKGAEMWIEILPMQVLLVKGIELLGSKTRTNNDDIIEQLDWIMFQMPEMELVNAINWDRTISTDDVEYKAKLNSKAKEGIEIGTICGTKAGGMQAARGAYFSQIDGKQIESFIRAGRETQAEELLIGTLYSQYATRHTTLSGEAYRLTKPFPRITEANQSNKVFIATSISEDLRCAWGDVKLVELRPDEYDKK